MEWNGLKKKEYNTDSNKNKIYGKEYDDEKLIFEGEYLNRKRNGFGKEYYNKDNLIFEGEYLNGMKWSGKVYESNNNKNIYELKYGKGIIKDYNYNYYYILIFEGEYLNGKKMGKEKNIIMMEN